MINIIKEEEKYTSIYLVENCYGDPNKVYIGKERSHKHHTQRKQDHKRTYGKQVTFTIIDQCVGWSKEDYKPLESFWIDYFKFLGFELMNKNEGGAGPVIYSEESKQKMKESKKVIWVSILQYDLEGNFMKIWNNITEASKEYSKFIYNSDITACCKNKQKSAFGFQWRYKTENYPLKIKPIKLKKGVTVEQCNINGDVIKEWETIKYATNKLKINGCSIRMCCKGQLITAGGFKWKYKIIT